MARVTAGGIAAVFAAERATLLRLLAARLGDRAEAEDALQDLWLKLAAAEPGPVGNPAAYLYRMAANLATDRRIAAARRARLESDWTAMRPAAAEYPGAEREMLARDAVRAAAGVIEAMPERMRAAYRMFRIEHLPQRTIAARLGISVSAVEKLLQRAYRRLHHLAEGDDA